MPKQQGDDRLVMELERRLSDDQDGSLRAEIKKQLDAMDKRLHGEAKKLQTKKVHQEIAAARQAVQGALVALDLVQSLRT